MHRLQRELFLIESCMSLGALEALPFTLSNPLILELRERRLGEGSSQQGLRNPAVSPAPTLIPAQRCHSELPQLLLSSYQASPSSVGEPGSDKSHSGELNTVVVSGGGRLFCKQPRYYLSGKH